MRIHFFIPIALTLVTTSALAEDSAKSIGAPAVTSEGNYTIKDFHFSDGETLPELRIHYRTLGQPVSAGGRTKNAVLLLHGTSTTGSAFLANGFRSAMFGPDQPLDANKYYLILPDSIGLGGSSKPSDGLHERFPHYGYNDMVEAQQRLVTQGLGINHLIAVLGTSMGGMHAWIWVHQFLDNAAALIWHNELDANDLVHRLEASADYDPAPDLNQVKAAVLSINFADDEINPPALGFIQREKEALPHGEFVLIPASNETVGHRTQGKASVYQKYVSAFMEKLNARQ